MGCFARMLVVIAGLGAGCLETPGTSSDAGGSGPDAGTAPGTTEWQIPLGTSSPYVALDDGDLVVAASFEGTIALDPPITADRGGNDFVLAGFSRDGEQLFANVFGGEGDELVTAVTASQVSGEIAVAGVYGSGEGNVGGETLPAPAAMFDMFIARYEPAGKHLWSLPGIATAGSFSAFGLSMSGNGAVALTGDCSSSMAVGGADVPYMGPGKDVYFVRVSSDGVPASVAGFGDAGDQIGAGLLFNGLGSLYLFGTQNGPFFLGDFSPDSDADGDLFVSRINDTGTVATWVMDSVGGRVGGLRGAVTPDGSLLLTGWFEVSFAFDLPSPIELVSRGGSDVFIALIRPDRTLAWIEQFGGIGDDEPFGLAVGPDGEFALTGAFRAEASLGDVEMASKGGADIFLLAFDRDHELRWAGGFGDVEDDSGLSVAVDEGGAVILGALYRGEVDFGGPAPLSSGGGDGGALVRFR